MSHPQATAPDADSLRSQENKSQEGQSNGAAQRGTCTNRDAGCPATSAGTHMYP